MWLLIAAAYAGPWQAEPLWIGADIAGNTGDVAVGVSIAGWSPLGRLVVALERETPNGLSRTHRLYLGTLDCPTGWGACGPLTLQEVGAPQDDKFNLTALALRPTALGPAPHLVRAVRLPGCAVPTRALEEWALDPATGVWSSARIHEPRACGDAQLSHAVIDADHVWACWTVDPVGAGFDDNLWCGTRALAAAVGPADTADTGDTGDSGLVGAGPLGWAVAGESNGVATQDHGWFVVQDGVRYLVHRDRDTVPATTRLRADGLTGALPASLGILDADFPSIAVAPDGTMHAVWVEAYRRVAYARCLADCADPASWEVQPRPLRLRAPGTVEHPEIAISADGRMFVFWSEDREPGPGEARRVHVKHKCLSDPMFTPGTDPGEAVYDLGQSPNDQTLLVGRPHVWIDDLTHTVHVVFLEKDTPGPDPIHGDAWRAWSTFDPCP